jgi:hypothetical protein
VRGILVIEGVFVRPVALESMRVFLKSKTRPCSASLWQVFTSADVFSFLKLSPGSHEHAF